MQNNCHFSKLIHEQAATYGERTALKYRDYDRNEWIPISWNAFSHNVRRVSRAMLSMGVGVQENLVVFSQNKPECLFVDFGAYGIQAVTIPLYATTSSAQTAYIINDAGVRFAFVGEQQQYDTLWAALPECPTLEKIILFDPKVRREEGDALSLYFDEFLNMGSEESDKKIQELTATATFDQIANILYTSGTTGVSKGVILLHSMYFAAFHAHNLKLDITEDDVILNFLPFTHVFERGWSYLCLTWGCTLCINLRPMDVQQSMKEVHPTCMSSVPRFWEKVYQAVLDRAMNGSAIQRWLILDAIKTGGDYWENYTAKLKPAPFGLRLKYWLYKKTIIKKLRHAIGINYGHCFPTAGAAVSPEVERFAHAAGLNMVVGYGLTESTASASFDHSDKVISLGSIGRPLPGLEVKIGENSEILLRGKTITPGYYKKPEETAAAIDADGWFHTGDAGYLKDGELYITERIKDLFKTSNGKYIAPQMIEGKITLDRFFEQAVIVADKYKFVSALIVPNFQLLEEYCKENGIEVHSKEDICANEQLHELLQARIDELLKDLANFEKVKRFTLLPQPFSNKNGELTDTLKVRRRVVYEHYAAEIEKMYR